MIFFCAPFLFAAGCKREEVREYRVPKAQAAAPTPALPPGHPAMDGPRSATLPPTPKLHWTLPAGWTEKPPSTMRVASFTVAGADGQTAEVGVIPLPATGSELDLVNMWRQQMKLPGVTAEDADKQAENIAVGTEPGKLYDIVSAEPMIEGKMKARVLVAMLTRGPMSWFFKMTGEDAFVAAQKPAFAEFLKSITFEESSAPAIAASAPVAASESAGAGSGLPEWQSPADWKSQPPGPMVLASFAIGDDATGKAMVSISSFPGDVGGLLANVNRWRGQVGLSALAEADLDKQVTTLDGGGKLVHFTGTDMASGSPKQLVGAVVPHAGQTWFYKMTGSEKVVGAQKEAFIKFVQSVKYPDAH